MATRHLQAVDFDEDDELDVAENLSQNTVAAVVTGTDWTTETIVTQLQRGNIQLNPRFQRRDAWKIDRKSRFIESLIVGLPIPQIVLAESKTERGKFIVLDGKQRLLTISQFWGADPTQASPPYALKGLALRLDLNGKTYAELSTDPDFEGDFNALCNQTVRTVVIRNWRDTNFLHTVFLRLNTGSVSLSPQELRQALLPGSFSDYVDDAAAQSAGLHQLLGTDGPDSRMRDIEILARFLAFRFFSDEYSGRMKNFLDTAFEEFNSDWATYEAKVGRAVEQFEEGVAELIEVFGDEVARKPGSSQFNRAIFDALAYFHSSGTLLPQLRRKRKAVRTAYGHLFDAGSPFAGAVESDTAGAPNTATRFKQWSAALAKVVGHPVRAPNIPLPPAKKARKSAASTKRATR